MVKILNLFQAPSGSFQRIGFPVTNMFEIKGSSGMLFGVGNAKMDIPGQITPCEAWMSRTNLSLEGANNGPVFF